MDRAQSLGRHSAAARYGVAVACTALALLARMAVDPFLQDNLPYVTFFVAVTVAAWFGGLRPALLATALCFLAADWFFISPRHALWIMNAREGVGAASYFMVALAIAFFGHAMLKAREEALRRLRDLEREIAERERAEEGLASLARFPSENPNPVLRMGTDGTILYANEASRLFAPEGSCAIGATAPDFLRLPAEDAVANRSATAVDIQRGERTWSFFIAPMPGSGYINLYGQDVTEQRRAEQARVAQMARLAALTQVSEQILAATTVEALLQQVVDAARQLIDARIAVSAHGFENNQFRIGRVSHAEGLPPCPEGGVFTMDRGGVYMLLVEGAASIRLTEAELPAHPRWRGLPEGHAPLRGLLGARLISSNAEVNGLIMVSGKCGGEFTEEDERLLCQLATVASLSLRHIEARLDAVNEKNRLEAVLESLPVGVAILDAQGGNQRSNEAFGKIWGEPRPPARGIDDYALFKAWWEDSGQPVQPGEWASAKAVRQGSTVVGQSMRIETFDGASRFVLNSAAPVRDAAGQIAGCVVTLQDVTGLKRAEQELRRSNEDLSQFAFVISHDLRSPLNAVTSFARQLKEDYQHKLGAEADTYLSFLTGATDRMRRLISDLLAYSRVAGDGAAQAGPASSEEALRSAEMNLQDRIGESQAVVTHDPLPDVQVNSTLLGQLFQNLLENALKFRGAQAPRIHVSATRQNREWVFRVTDNGIGIDPQQAEQVFRIFRRLHGDEYEGTGIGLALCKKIVERHGGRIWVESEPGQGSQFCFTLPVRLGNNG